jgi:thiamine pyrophosphokinase
LFEDSVPDGEDRVRAIIVAGGQVGGDEGWRQWVGEGDWIIGADGGAAQALAWGLVPHLVIGDMDSLPEEARAALEARGSRFVVHPRAKDETDLELALTHAAQQGAREIVVLGALGGRLDHTVANVLLLALPQLDGVVVRIAGDGQEALLVRGGGEATLEGRPGDLVSLLPLGGDVRGVTTSGLAWPLAGDTLRFGFSRGVSNEMTAPVARIAVQGGYLLVVHGRAC